MSSGALSHTTRPNLEQAFFDWYVREGRDLWALAAFGFEQEEGLVDEFLSTLQYVQGKFRLRRGRLGDLELTRAFLLEWQRRRQGQRHVLRPGQERLQVALLSLDFDERLLVLALFRLKWDFSKAAEVWRLKGSSLSFRVFRSLSLLSGHKFDGYPGGECAKHDLFVPDYLRGHMWSDPLHLYTHKDFTEHQRKCSRCSGLDKALEQLIEPMRRLPLPRLPNALESQDAHELEQALKPFAGLWFSGLPPWVRMPLQIAVLASAMYLVLALPFAGELLPGVRSMYRRARLETWPRVMTWAEHKWPSLLKRGQESAPIAAAPVDIPPLEVARSEERQKPLLPPPASLKDGLPPAQALLSPTDPSESLAAPLSPSDASTAARSAFRQRLADVGDALSSRVSQAKNSLAERWQKWRESRVEVAQEAPPPPAPAPVAVPEAAPAPIVAAKAPPPVPVAGPPPPALKPSKVEAKVAETALEERMSQRWIAYSSDVAVHVPAIVKVLHDYGAAQAGQLALGANYNNGKYFHFYVPEENYQAVYQATQALGLNKFSTSPIKKDKEPVPSGQRRVVFWLGGT